MAKQGKIRAGIGGWTFEPWRGVFYPKGLTHAKELGYASQHVTSIEINGTFYSTQKPATYAKWRTETPEGFVFSVKGIRYAVNRRVLAEAGDSIKRFLDSGVTELGDRLGLILWQFAGTKKFDEADFGKFLELLPRETRQHAVAARGGAASHFVLYAGIHLAHPAVLDPGRVRGACDLPGDPRSRRRLRVSAPAEGQGRHQDRLSAQGAGPVGRAGAGVGRGRHAQGPGADRCQEQSQGAAARCVRVFHPRGQGARARRRRWR